MPVAMSVAIAGAAKTVPRFAALPARARLSAPPSNVSSVALRRRAQQAIHVEGEAAAVADPARLEQLLGHLLQNAIEASPPAAPITLRLIARGALAGVEVIDRGTGMSAAFIRDQLFKPFVSQKPGGFGLGAFEARQLAEAMGGRVEVESREGAGSCFRVLLPAAPALEAAA